MIGVVTSNFIDADALRKVISESGVTTAEMTEALNKAFDFSKVSSSDVSYCMKSDPCEHQGDIEHCSDCLYCSSSGLVNTLTIPMDYGAIKSTISTDADVYASVSKPILASFSCPCCGTHFIAGDPGFIPNCHNCGSVMRKD